MAIGLMLGFFLSIACSNAWAASGAPPLRITGVTFDPASLTLRLTGDRGERLTYSSRYSVVKQRKPDRVIMDIKEAELAAPAGGTLINREGVKTLDVQEMKTPFYKSVRITIFVDNKRVLKHVANALTDKPVTVAYDSNTAAPTATSLERPIPGLPKPMSGNKETQRDPSLPVAANVIRDIYFKDGMLYLQGANKAQLQFKKRLVMDSPSRLIIDLDNASVESKALLKPILTNDPDVRLIRIGQFDEKTVRLVFETQYPDRFYASYPSQDKSIMTIGTHFTHSASTLPNAVGLGQLERVSLERKPTGEPILRLVTNVPMVQEVSRDDDRVYIELPNIAARPGMIAFDQRQFPQVESLRIENLSVGQPNSKLVLALKRDTGISAQLSNQGRTLDLLLGEPGRPFSITGRGSSSTANVPTNKVLFNATVVVDAGHGGKDIGANRAGVYEKNLNLTVAHKLRKALEDRGVKVVMTRSTDEFLPLPRISQIANNVGPDVFVSVHTNASTNPGIAGLETYYYTAHSRPLADSVHSRLVNTLNIADRGVRRAMFYVIHHTTAPAILCEMGYISNATEREHLQNEVRQAKTAQAIAEGVVAYLNRQLSAQGRPKRATP